MESTAFFEKKISLTPSDLNRVKKTSFDDILLGKARELLEKKCSEHGFVLPGSVKLISRSMGRFEDGNKTADAINYLKLEGKVIYPVDGIRVIGEVIRKNKMGLYVEYKKAMRIQVPRDLHIGSEEYESVEVGDLVEIELKRSKFQINDLYILSSGIFIAKKGEVSEILTQEEITRETKQMEAQEELDEAEIMEESQEQKAEEEYDINEEQQESEEEQEEEQEEEEDE